MSADDHRMQGVRVLTGVRSIYFILKITTNSQIGLVYGFAQIGNMSLPEPMMIQIH